VKRWLENLLYLPLRLYWRVKVAWWRRRVDKLLAENARLKAIWKTRHDL
jgi:hypothetical protein